MPLADGHWRSIATEGGHADFAPRGPEQIELLEYLSGEFDHVTHQYLSRVVSLDSFGSFALRPVGFAAAGVLASAVGARPILILGGLIGFATFALSAWVPAIRHLE